MPCTFVIALESPVVDRASGILAVVSLLSYNKILRKSQSAEPGKAPCA